MKEDRWYYVLIQFLKEYRFTGILFLIFTGIFINIFSLYHLEAEAILYSAFLCLFVSVIILGFRFYYYYKRYEARKDLLANITYHYDRLPRPLSLSEKDYQKMLLTLGKQYTIQMTERENSRQESMDYYTTWVHQIKTPISVMQMMLQSEDTDEHRELSAELFRIQQYVEMVLSYLRLGSDTNDFVIEEYDLDTIIKEAIHKYASQFVRYRIRLIYEPVTCKVITDSKWLQFIIEQLLSNALKYTRQGAITITVTKDQLLQISDTGIGIEPEDLPRIFERGFTGYNGRSDKKSTGLGLYLCKQVAKKLSITIKAESTPKVGSTFTLDLKQHHLEVD